MGKEFSQWKTVTIAQGEAISAEVDLKGEFEDVQVYNPAMDDASITVKPVRATGGDEVVAYLFNAGETGDFENITEDRETPGMNVFKNICARFVKVVLSEDQAGGERVFYIRGINSLGARAR